MDINKLEGDDGIAPLYEVLDIRESADVNVIHRQMESSVQAVQFLLENGANVDGDMNGGETPFEYESQLETSRLPQSYLSKALPWMRNASCHF